jgi:hypothetical protein
MRGAKPAHITHSCSHAQRFRIEKMSMRNAFVSAESLDWHVPNISLRLRRNGGSTLGFELLGSRFVSAMRTLLGPKVVVNVVAIDVVVIGEARAFS